MILAWMVVNCFFIIFLPFHCCLDFNLAVQFLSLKNVKFATGFLCQNSGKVAISKMMSVHGIRCNMPSLEKIINVNYLEKALDFPSAGKTGVVIDMKCEGSQNVLQMASDNRLMDSTRTWIIFTGEIFTSTSFRDHALAMQPPLFNFNEYLEEGTSEMKAAMRMREINADFNQVLLDDPELLALQRINNNSHGLVSFVSPQLDFLTAYVSLKAMVDSDVNIATQSVGRDSMLIYQIHRKTLYTTMEIETVARVSSSVEGGVEVVFDVSPVQPPVLRRRDFHGAVLRSACAHLYWDYASKGDEISFQRYDFYSRKQTSLALLAEQRLNFRILIKNFDEYGWAEGGHFTGMLKFLHEQKVDMTAGGMLLYTPRMAAASYVDSGITVRTLLILKQPPLSQVTNIFALTFSSGVWTVLLILLLATAALMYAQFSMLRKIGFKQTESDDDASDVLSFVIFSTLKQGMSLLTNRTSTRLTTFVFLFSTLFLFTAYTANITALLQSPSNFIKDINDFTRSPFEMGVENLPYQKKLFEESNDPQIKELFMKKLSSGRELGTAYRNSSDGMNRVRKGLYGFYLETSTAGTIVSATFTEAEKCRIQTLAFLPKLFNGHVVPKKSPYWEIMAQRWTTETGFSHRFENRFTRQLLKCKRDGAGYDSIAIADIRYVITLWSYGALFAVFLIFIEILYSRWQHRTISTGVQVFCE